MVGKKGELFRSIEHNFTKGELYGSIKHNFTSKKIKNMAKKVILSNTWD